MKHTLPGWFVAINDNAHCTPNASTRVSYGSPAARRTRNRAIAQSRVCSIPRWGRQVPEYLARRETGHA
eukprot:4720736-Alexandrium_andersonii.AAC.1